MSPAGLLPEEETILRALYARDVVHWSWSHWLSLYRKFGEAIMGLSWVLLPYKPEDAMPAARRRMNELYFSALEEQAAEYGLCIRLDEISKKLILYRQEE